MKEIKNWDVFKTYNFFFLHYLLLRIYVCTEPSFEFGNIIKNFWYNASGYNYFEAIKNYLRTTMRQSDWVVSKVYQLKEKSGKKLIFKSLFIILLERNVIELSYSELINRFANTFNTYYYYYYNIFFIFQKPISRNYLSLLFLLPNFCSRQYNDYLLRYRKIEWLHDTKYLIQYLITTDQKERGGINNWK